MDQSIAQKFNMLRTKMFRWLELALPATSPQYSLLGVHLEILDLRMPKRPRNGPRSKKKAKSTTDAWQCNRQDYFDFCGGKGRI